MKRVISSLLVVVLILTMALPVGAADTGSRASSVNAAVDVVSSSEFYTAIDSKFSSAPSLPNGVTRAFLWGVLDSYVRRVGRMDSLATMERLATALNLEFPQAPLELRLVWRGIGSCHWTVTLHPKYGYVLYDEESSLYLCNSAGAFPYYKESSSSSGSTDTVGGGKWLGSRSCDINGKVVILTEDVLSGLCVDLNGMGQTCTITTWGNTYKVIQKDNYYYYCNPDGLPYVARIDESSHASSTTNNYYTENSGDNIYNEGDTNNFQWIDNSTSTVLSPSGDINFIDQLIYDGSTKTYYVDAHEQYDTTNNTYVSNKYEYQYHIAYTSVTYIGQTEEYEETYKFYYQLPDGRSSADLTKEDLEQLSLSFKDVVNYARTADDLSQRVLYHFDGNTTDASYWSYATKFDWGSGATLTYMDEGVFGGSLYLDETAHDFTITLPSERDAAGDFTLQFRYYQSYTETTGSSRILIGGKPVLYFTGTHYQFGSKKTPTSVGSWNEICLMRKDFVLYCYINGVCIGSVEDPTAYGNTVGFVFDSIQQTYKKLDELRFTRGAIYEAGENYTVSSVPFDSNLTLVLPDGEFPLADEIITLSHSPDNLLISRSLHDWTTGSKPAAVYSASAPKRDYTALSLYYNNNYTSIVPGSSSVGVTVSGSGAYADHSDEFLGGLFLPVYEFEDLYYDEDDYELMDEEWHLNSDSIYTLVVQLADGSFSYVTFRTEDFDFYNWDFGAGGVYPLSLIGSYDGAGITFSVDRNTFESIDEDEGSSEYYCFGVWIQPTIGQTVDIVYMELIEGNGPQFDYEFAVYSSGQLTESPVLAVRSALDVTSYQFGGVRPSYPEIGQVWALVENGRISSLQQYTGYAWESVDGRIWTGQRWVPYYAFDVLLLKDMFDIIEADPSQDFIYTQEGFWSWLQKAWAQMMDKLDQIAKGSGGAAVDPGDLSQDSTVLPGVQDDPVTDEDDGWSFIDLLVVVKDGAWDFTTGLVSKTFGGLIGFASSLGRVSDFFNSYSRGNEDIFGILNYGGSDIWD